VGRNVIAALDLLAEWAPDCHSELGIQEYREVLDRLPRVVISCERIRAGSVAVSNLYHVSGFPWDPVVVTARARGPLRIRLTNDFLISLTLTPEMLASTILHEVMHYGGLNHRENHNSPVPFTSVEVPTVGCVHPFLEDRIYFLEAACTGLQAVKAGRARAPEEELLYSYPALLAWAGQSRAQQAEACVRACVQTLTREADSEMSAKIRELGVEGPPAWGLRYAPGDARIWCQRIEAVRAQASQPRRIE
jgi:hypothetical protein